ncbi:hypothetical protein IVB69_06075 [Flavobacterium sp. J49]|uniref:hypothetical protein n=1 Tax=Flavobacterium sp. J49 TaxID=2718534 RepID=UPI00159337E0|nr:hypothetical protein [Flavobacterium sp. J49]MBF6641040.1 hypothetical protein [Flavobacterium sp. J49]NIC02287.1 hypothetical protein [Flavobacterium sp. J49]
MLKSKIYKISGVLMLLALLAGGIWYWQLPNRHKAIVKSFLFEKLGLVEKDWKVANQSTTYKMISPEFYIDGIYKSMEGPKSSNYVQLSQDSTLLWLTGFEVKALDNKTLEQVSKDFICHTNIDFNDVKYYSSFHLEKRIGTQYPRLTSLSHGMESFSFPKGYGVPMKGNELLYVTTESLNHNLPDANFWIRHQVDINYSKANNLKPLMSRTAFIMLPYDQYDPKKSPTDPGTNQCIPVETKNHSYDDGKGNKLSGHWVIPTGKNTYRSSVTSQLQIKDSLCLHAAAIHVHPFATSISLYDKTNKKTIFKSTILNHKGKTGLTGIDPFSTEEGIWLFGNHEYEIVLEVNNTSASEQDMMGSMFLFFYDKELDAYLRKN